jgi:hypothetical protein
LIFKFNFLSKRGRCLDFCVQEQQNAAANSLKEELDDNLMIFEMDGQRIYMADDFLPTEFVGSKYDEKNINVYEFLREKEKKEKRFSFKFFAS